MILRGLARRCPFCGHNKIFASWFKLKERCPSCGHRFHQEEGFYIGAYAINFAITEGLLLLCLIPYILLSASNPDSQLNAVPFAITALVAAVAGPILFFPFSRSLWIALDLTLRGGRNLDDPSSGPASDERPAHAPPEQPPA